MALIKRNDNFREDSLNSDKVNTILGPGAVFEGKLVYRGALRIDGEFKGTVDSDDTLILGENAKVDAEINVGELVVEGKFSGKAVASKKAHLKTGASFFGNISTKGLIIEEGVIFEGNCSMSEFVNGATDNWVPLENNLETR